MKRALPILLIAAGTLLLFLAAAVLGAARFDDARRVEIPRWNIPGRIAAINFASVWSRTLRYGGEREATANALRIASGQPIVESSVCRGGRWSYVDGTLSFPKDAWESVAASPPMPLELVVP